MKGSCRVEAGDQGRRARKSNTFVSLHHRLDSVRLAQGPTYQPRGSRLDSMCARKYFSVRSCTYIVPHPSRFLGNSQAVYTTFYPAIRASLYLHLRAAAAQNPDKNYLDLARLLSPPRLSIRSSVDPVVAPFDRMLPNPISAIHVS